MAARELAAGVGLILRGFALAKGVCIVLALAALATTGLAAKKPVKKPLRVEDPPMTFTVVRSDATGCEPNCPEWIEANGRITAASPSGLNKILKKLGPQHLPLLINSPGGDVEAAIAMGRAIRKAGLDIAVGLTRYTGCTIQARDCKPPAKGQATGLGFSYGAYCFSACPLILAAGNQRLVGIWAAAGVHQIVSSWTRTMITYRVTYRIVNGRKQTISKNVVSRKNAGVVSTTKLGAGLEKRIKTYLKDMGISEKLLAIALATPPSDIHRLTVTELTETKLTTGLMSGETLIDFKLCTTASPPSIA